MLAAASPNISRQMSFAAGKNSSSPMVKVFLALAIRSATKYDPLSAATLIDVVAFNRCYVMLWRKDAVAPFVNVVSVQNNPTVCISMLGV